MWSVVIVTTGARSTCSSAVTTMVGALLCRLNAMTRYTVVLHPDPDEGGFTVTVPALPGCITEGETLDEALANAREAIELRLEVLMEDGQPIPVEPEPLVTAVEVESPLGGGR